MAFGQPITNKIAVAMGKFSLSTPGHIFEYFSKYVLFAIKCHYLIDYKNGYSVIIYNNSRSIVFTFSSMDFVLASLSFNPTWLTTFISLCNFILLLTLVFFFVVQNVVLLSITKTTHECTIASGRPCCFLCDFVSYSQFSQKVILLIHPLI